MSRLQFLVRHSGEAALGVLHHDDGVDAEHMDRQRQTAQHVVGHPTTGVADDVRLTEVQAKGREHVDASVHARDDGEPPTRSWISDVCPCGGVPLVGLEQPADLCHAI